MMSPPLLQPLLVSPISVSSGMTEETRLSRVLKNRTSPRLLSSTTYPLPAHRPWSAGSRSPFGLVLSVPLSTALRPLTPFAPPGLRLILSHPDRSGSQLTAGGTGSGSALATIGDGMRWARADGFARRAAAALRAAVSALAALAAALALADPTAKDAVDGVANGPVSRSHPLAQPVAAGPTKVGEKVPRLEEVTERPGVSRCWPTRLARPPRASRSVALSQESDRQAVEVFLAERHCSAPCLHSGPRPRERSGADGAPHSRRSGLQRRE